MVLPVMLMALIGCQESDPGTLRAIMPDNLVGPGVISPCMEAADADRLVQQMLDRVNQERRARDLPPVRRNDTLDQIANFYACRLIDGGFFSHVDPYDDSRIDTRAADFGYAYRKIGENLAAGQISVEQVLRDWMDSAGHRANILDPEFTEIGLAVRLGGQHGVYWVQEFGRPLATGRAADSPGVMTPVDDDAAPMTPATQPAAGVYDLPDFPDKSALAAY